MGYNASALTTYVENNKDVLIKSVVLGDKYGDTIKNLRKQLGVKTSELLNYLDYNLKIQDGKGCGFSADGQTVLSDRKIDTYVLKVNDSWCPDDMLNKFSEFLVRFGANANAEDGFPFESEIVSEIQKSLAKETERLAWVGDRSGTDLVDGFLTQALGADSAATISLSETGATSAISLYDVFKKIILNIPTEIEDDAVIFCGSEIFKALVFELVEKNMYHFESGKNGEVVEDTDLVFPGSRVKIHKTRGLDGQKKSIYCTSYANMVMAADLLNDQEEFRIFFSDDDDVYKLKIKWNMGFKTLYPADVIVLTSTNNLVA